MSQQRCSTNRTLVALLACLCGPLAPCVPAFSQRTGDRDTEWQTEANGSKLTSSRISDPAPRLTGIYNALNRLDLLIDRSPTNSIINCWKYHATGAGQRTWVEEFDHRTAWYTYDSLGRLKTEAITGSIQDGKNGTVTYGYDNVGNRLTIQGRRFGFDTRAAASGKISWRDVLA